MSPSACWLLLLLAPLRVSASCGFPAIADQAEAFFHGQPIGWIHRTMSFPSGAKVEFRCVNLTQMIPERSGAISCMQNGQWSRPPPRCYHALTWNWDEFLYKRPGPSDLPSKSPVSNSCQRGNVSASFQVPVHSDSPPGHVSYVQINTCKGERVKSVALAAAVCDHIVDAKNNMDNLYSCRHKGHGGSTELQIELEHEGDLSTVTAFYSRVCGWPPVPTNGFVDVPSDWNPFESLRVRYGCDQHYELVGDATNVCDPTTGQWKAAAQCQLTLSRYHAMLTDLILDLSHRTTACLVMAAVALIAILAIVIAGIYMASRYALSRKMASGRRSSMACPGIDLCFI